MGTVWARSSMVEQWPFKPLVKGSSPFALTEQSSFFNILPPSRIAYFRLLKSITYFKTQIHYTPLVNKNRLSYSGFFEKWIQSFFFLKYSIEMNTMKKNTALKNPIPSMYSLFGPYSSDEANKEQTTPIKRLAKII
jgi:hypothetical protein